MQETNWRWYIGGAILLVACGNETPPTTSENATETSITPGESGTATVDTGTTVDGSGTGLPTGNTDSLTGDCGEVSVVVDQIIPTIVLLVDQSGSMTADFSTPRLPMGIDRWTAVYETLMDPDAGVVAELESQVRFGLTLYTSEEGFAGGECPMLTSVDPALDNHATIDAVYGPEEPVQDTPTGESLAAVAQSLAEFDAIGPKAIVLATDGEPDTCAVPNPQEGQPESLAAAALAYELGIETFIISVGDEVGADHLQEMANVGVGKAPDDPNPAPYYEALNTAQLVEAFGDIIDTVISCEFAIDGIVELLQKCEGTVILDGNVLECGVDWDLIDESTLVLLGEACEAIKDGGMHNVTATWPCGVVAIP